MLDIFFVHIRNEGRRLGLKALSRKATRSIKAPLIKRGDGLGVVYFLKAV